MVEIAIEAPIEIKKPIARKLQKSGALKKIERKIKLGMMVAIEELREDPGAPGNLERRKFKKASPYELRALQVVYNFLAERGLTYTLSAVLEESCEKRNQGEVADIRDLLQFTQAGAVAAMKTEEEEDEEEDDDAPPESPPRGPQVDDADDFSVSDDEPPPRPAAQAPKNAATRSGSGKRVDADF
jgi:hypothetical protein